MRHQSDEVLNWEDWSLRRQFVVPLAITIVVVAVLVTWISLWSASDAYQRLVFDRMDSVSQQIRTATYPLTKNVLQQIQNYSGVDVVLIAIDNSVAMVSLVDAEGAWLNDFVAASPPPRGRVLSGLRELDYAYFPFSDEPMAREYRGMFLMIEDNHRSGMWQASVWAPAASGLVSVVAIVLVTTLIVSRIVRRIERLEGQVNRIASGQYEVITPAGPADSIHRLSRSINSLSQQLESAHDWIAKTERSRLITLIAGGMAHQLRNALTGASLLLQSYMHHRSGQIPEEIAMAQNQLKIANESVRRLLASDSGIDLIDEPDLTIEAIQRSLSDCVVEYAKHHSVHLQLVASEHVDKCNVPQGAAVVGALVNLIMNAIEAAGERGTVRCELCAPDDANVTPSHIQGPAYRVHRWRITDNGPGPAESVVHAMMEPFVTTKKDGVGLGLPMAARTAERCHGQLQWKREGDLTVFEFSVRGEPIK